MAYSRKAFATILLVVCLFVSSNAFAPLSQQIQMSSMNSLRLQSSVSPSSLGMSATSPLFDAAPASSTFELSAGAIDPTTVLSDLLGAFLTTPLILAVPIVAALSVAGLLAFFIVSYANPEVEDDE